MKADQFADQIISWYRKNKRELPWRESRNPYHIWLSEVILQQTRVDQGMPYYFRFIEKFKTIRDLAKADERDVLRVWQGLGYYSRARNLHKCAKIIISKHQGEFPSTYVDLLKLPGVGPYTAAAIASFAFKEKAAVVDGNVYRVLSRVFGIEDDIASGKGQKVFQEKANELISEIYPDDYNQGIMEFGALHCTPKKPKCSECIFGIECFARENNRQTDLPVKTKKTKVRKRYFNYLVVQLEEKLLLTERTEKDIWQGLYDFPLVESDRLLDLDDLLKNDFSEFFSHAEEVEISKDYKHILSHQQIYARFFELKLKKKASINFNQLINREFFTRSKVLELPKPVLISAYLNESVID